MDYWPSADLENPASIEEFNGVSNVLIDLKMSVLNSR